MARALAGGRGERVGRADSENPRCWYPADAPRRAQTRTRSEEHTSELQSQSNVVCRLMPEKKRSHAHRSPDSLPAVPVDCYQSFAATAPLPALPSQEIVVDGGNFDTPLIRYRLPVVGKLPK